MPKILFIAAHRPNRSPSQRFRFEQYFDILRQNGWQVEFSFFLTQKDDEIIYKPGKYFQKLIIFLKSFIKRINDLKKAKKVDVVFVQREAFMTGSIFFEKRISKWSNMIFDFDDSIWLHDVNPNQGILNKLKDPGKTAKIIKLSKLVIAGNQYLKEFARQYNDNVIIIPTTIDTDEYKKIAWNKLDDKICIGWSGSFSTIKHFNTLIEPLRKLKEKYQHRIHIKVIGDGSYYNSDLEIRGISWNKQNEIKDLSEIDIGIMPLPDDEWSKGKCGLKGLQYMALGIPTIMSPVGVNSEIIQDHINGMLASSNDEWVEKLSMLIESKELREKIGTLGKETVEAKYSVKANAQKYLDAFGSLLKQ